MAGSALEARPRAAACCIPRPERPVRQHALRHIRHRTQDRVGVGWDLVQLRVQHLHPHASSTRGSRRVASSQTPARLVQIWASCRQEQRRRAVPLGWMASCNFAALSRSDAGLETGGPSPVGPPGSDDVPVRIPTHFPDAPLDSAGSSLNKPPERSGTSPGPGIPPTSRRRISRHSACRHHVDGRRTARR